MLRPLAYALFLVLAPARVAAQGQPTFHLKIDSLSSAVGLVVLPGGQVVTGGSRADCLQLCAFDPGGQLLWSKRLCPLKSTDQFEHGSLRLERGAGPDEFFALFSKGSSAPGPDHVLNLLKFDLSGNLLWECQLPPYVSFGNIASGRQMSAAADGTVWAVHGIGDLMPAVNGQSFNRVLLFKISAAGVPQFRNSYKTIEQSTANGVVALPGGEVFVYGGLGYVVGDGFLLKLDASGAVEWGKRYPGFQCVRDGGRFANGDLLLSGAYDGGTAFARVRLSDGEPVWLKRLADVGDTGLYQVAGDDGIFAMAAGEAPGMPRALVKIASGAGAVEWMRSYESCTRFLILNAAAAGDKGLVFTQHANNGLLQTRLLKINAQGEFSGGCPATAHVLPAVEDLLPQTSPLVFLAQIGDLPQSQPVVDIAPQPVGVVELCPGRLPEAGLHLPDSVCAGSPLLLAAAGNANGDYWRWWLPGARPDTAQGAILQNLVYDSPGVYPVTLVQQFGVCADTLHDTMRVTLPLAESLFAFDDTLHCPDRPFVAIAPGGGFDSWVWDDGSAAPQRVFDPPRAGQYRLTVRRAACSFTDSFTLRLARCETTRFYAPNAFAPAASPPNDVWTVSLPAGFALLSCRVFDRWGDLVYESPAGELPRWTGDWRGREAPAGIYGWAIRLSDPDGAVTEERGDVFLMR